MPDFFVIVVQRKLDQIKHTPTRIKSFKYQNIKT